MRKATLILHLILFMTFKSYSQEITDRTIEVIGSHEIEIEPNEIYLEIEIKEENNGREKVKVNEKENFLKNGLQEIGIDLSKLKIKNSYGRSYKIKRKEDDLLIEKKYSLEVNDMVIFNKLLERASDLGIENIKIEKKDHSEREKYELETKREAVKKVNKKLYCF